jgi:D-beta-D-heptose 7-phosphate kinase / D-beta-D-heptose 1-phosphate adenosyltransferase
VPITDAVELVARFRQQRVLVIGEAMLDCYYSGRAERISPEGPVPVVTSTTKTRYPGGATNAAANVAALGGQARCLSVIGADESGTALKAELEDRGVEADLIVDPERATLTKLRILADGQYVVRFDEGMAQPLSPSVEQALIERLRAGFAECSAVIVADYCYGVLSERVIVEIGRLKEAHNRLVLVDSKNLPLYRGMTASVITPNHLEAQRAVGWNVRDVDRLGGAELEDLGRRLLDSIGSTWAMVTLGPRGSLLFERDQPTYRIAARPVGQPHVSGAGDTFTATLALGLAAGGAVRVAAEVAAEAAAVVVGKPGTATVSSQELLQRLARSGLLPAPRAELETTLAQYRRAGKRIVFTNGVFDGLNSGHLAFLRSARELGDLLIVGVNSDRGLESRRGYAARLPEVERLAIVAALEVVDHVILFDEPTPTETIRVIRPDFHVKGGDYRLEEIPEASAVQECGGEIVILPLMDGHGATAIGRKVLYR